MGLGTGIRDQGSGKKPIPDPRSGPGVKKALDPGSGSATLFKILYWVKFKQLLLLSTAFP
jgi:hypothetical protein